MTTYASHLENNELTAELTRLARCEREATAALIVHLAEFDAAPAVRGRRLSVAVQVLNVGATTLRGRGLQPHHRGTGGTAVSRHHREARERRAQPHDGAPPCALSDTREPPGAPGRRFGPGHTGGRGAAGAPIPTAGCGRTRAEGPDAAGDGRRTSGRAHDEQLSSGRGIRAAAGGAFGSPRHRRASRPRGAAAGTRCGSPTRARAIRDLGSRRAARVVRSCASKRTCSGMRVPAGTSPSSSSARSTRLVAELWRKKFADLERPRRIRGQSDESRNIQAEVRRAVSARDRSRCVFRSCGGRRCNERRFLEFHHLVPYAAGGKPTVDNIQLRCRAHNGHEVEQFFGPGNRWTRSDVVREGRRVYGAQERAGSSSWNDHSSTPPSSTSRGRVTRLRADGDRPL